MVVALIRIQPYNPRLLKKIPIDVSTSNLPSATELDSNELSEARGVVVPDRLRVTKGFEDRIGSEDLFGEIGEVLCA
jgi:hypothetical protein